MLFDLALLCCPACQQSLTHDDNTLHCQQCGARYGIHDGMPVLLTNTDTTTKLDTLDYDDHHGISDSSLTVIHTMWKTVLDENRILGGNVLEIGCGTGQLTATLAAMPTVKTIHATDISLDFLRMTKNRVSSPQSAVYYYACDANQLPFTANTFDLIVANSVLHHLLDYPRVLQQCARLLKPGGAAVFFEPVLQGKIMVAFLADLMLRIHSKTGYGSLTEEDRNKIDRMVRHITKARHIGNDRELLSMMEDKFVFDLHELQSLALQSGFSTATHRNNPAQDGNYRFNLHQHLSMAGIEDHKITEFRFLMNAAHEMLIEMIPKDLMTPMGFFVFRK